MKTEDFLKQMVVVTEIQKNHDDFYELAEKYGFFTPWHENKKYDNIEIIP